MYNLTSDDPEILRMNTASANSLIVYVHSTTRSLDISSINEKV